MMNTRQTREEREREDAIVESLMGELSGRLKALFEEFKQPGVGMRQMEESTWRLLLETRRSMFAAVDAERARLRERSASVVDGGQSGDPSLVKLSAARRTARTR